MPVVEITVNSQLKGTVSTVVRESILMAHTSVLECGTPMTLNDSNEPGWDTSVKAGDVVKVTVDHERLDLQNTTKRLRVMIDEVHDGVYCKAPITLFCFGQHKFFEIADNYKDTTVIDLMQKIQNAEAIPIDRQTLYLLNYTYVLPMLDHQKSLGEYNVENGDTIIVHVNEVKNWEDSDEDFPLPIAKKAKNVYFYKDDQWLFETKQKALREKYESSRADYFASRKRCLDDLMAWRKFCEQHPVEQGSSSSSGVEVKAKQ